MIGRRKAKIWLLLISGVLLLGIFGCIAVLGNFKETGELCINEVQFSSFWPDAENKDHPQEWIEIYNGTEEDVNLQGYGLSDDPDEPLKWTFPDVTVAAGAYTVVYTEKYAGEEPKTNFSLANQREYVVFSEPQGERIDMVCNEISYDDFSVGRFPDGGALAILKRVTPGTSNNGSFVSQYLREEETFGEITFSHEGGYYQEAFSLSLQGPQDCTIIYTLDGSEPEITSGAYREPIEIYDRSPEENLYAGKVQRTSDMESAFSQINDDPVTKGTVVRARLVRDGVLDSKIYTETYFVGIEETLTAISLVLDPDDLFDYNEGIYTRGNIYDWAMRTTPAKENSLRYLGNYSLNGKESERRGDLEVFSAAGETLIDQSVGVRVATGMQKRRSPNKTLGLYASKKYDEQSEFETPFWSFHEGSSEQAKRLLVRTNAFPVANIICDAFVTTLYLNQGMGVQAYEPAVLYLNGELWGLAALRERIDAEFVERHFDVDKDRIAVLKVLPNSETMEIEYGSEKDLQEFTELESYIIKNDMSVEERYRYVQERLDTESLIKHWWAHIFFAARDWPDNNIRFFRTQEAVDDRFGDGRWRCILYDMDFSCTEYEHDTLRYALGDYSERGYAGWSEDLRKSSTDLFGALMENREFRSEFLAYYVDNRTTLFDPDFLRDHLDTIVGELEPYFEKVEQRWHGENTPWVNALLQGLSLFYKDAMGLHEVFSQDIDAELEALYEFLERRRSYMDRFVTEYYQSMGEAVEIG